MKRTIAILCLLVLGACATPQEKCLKTTQGRVAAAEKRIAVTQGNIDRGYAVHVSRRLQTSVGICTGRVFRTCVGQNNGPVETPVSIDISEERKKLERQRAELSAAQIAYQSQVSQCRRVVQDSSS